MIKAAIGSLAILLLAAPFVGLVVLTDWARFDLPASDGEAVAVSVSYGLAALAVIALLGTPLALWLATAKSKLRNAAQLFLLLPLLTPPLALGILLAAFYGPIGPVGVLLGRFGMIITNNPAAFLLAGIYAGLPTFVVAARGAFAEIPPELAESALTLGVSRRQIFRYITLPMARDGLGAALALAWVRGVGELGIVLIFAYFPQGMPIRLWVDLEDSGLDATFPLLWVFLLAALPLPLWLLRRSAKR
ncbi:MAG: ABC transporter permease subunit [Acidiphilium sp.]|nr:ABC transporter permease subunit [Acidiphilium sp.]MDD4936354.1 ABC transporter permease subunit [Acidiphilium sp.]